MSRQQCACERVVVVPAPVIPPCGGANDRRCISASPRDDDIGTGAKCSDDASGANVRVCARWLERPAVKTTAAVLEMVEVLTGSPQLVEAVNDVVALDVGNLEIGQAFVPEEAGHFLRQPTRVERTGVGQNLGTGLLNGRCSDA